MDTATKSIARRLRLLTLSLMPLLLFGGAFALLSCSSEKEKPKELTPDQVQGTLIRELIMMAEQEQRDREMLDSIINEKGWRSPEGQAIASRSAENDSTNMARLEQIISQYGWPGKSLVGDQASMAAFLVLQHADLPRQEKYLPMVQAAAEKGDVEKSYLAMLQDRVLMRQNKPQKYGTQLWNDPSTGELGLYTIEDSVNVDQRRAEMGLPPIADYLRNMGINPDSLGQRDSTNIIINLGDSTK